MIKNHFLVGIALFLVVACLWGCPQYKVYLAGQDALAAVARARGDAEANKILAVTISKELNQFIFVKGIADKHGTIYVPTEANLPITEAKDGPQNNR